MVPVTDNDVLSSAKNVVVATRLSFTKVGKK